MKRTRKDDVKIFLDGGSCKLGREGLQYVCDDTIIKIGESSISAAPNVQRQEHTVATSHFQDNAKSESNLLVSSSSSMKIQEILCTVYKVYGRITRNRRLLISEYPKPHKGNQTWIGSKEKGIPIEVLKKILKTTIQYCCEDP
ncbi:hypothetical protein Avbf_08476 [Armadillidium vulgare]|nr:hypothetical protein Avbf_08476 [Armadillidium vulgare]